MCEYCGCQEIPVIRELTREHDEVRALLAAARDAAEQGSLPEASRTLRTVVETLRVHTLVEEQGVFPALAREYPDHVAGLVHEHRTVEADFAAVLADPAADDWAERLVHGARTLVEHIFREQDGLFPAAVTTLDTQDWERAEGLRVTG